jgi:aryl-alcohol dehydrogenase-like predicted oxidoreductase
MIHKPYLPRQQRRPTMIDQAGTYSLGSRSVKRLGYGAMQLAGPGVFGPPRDHDQGLAVLRAAIAAGIDHIDTSDFYGPHVTTRLIREALSPYPDDLTIVTKIGARRGDDASWLPAFAPDELARAVEDNLRNLGLEAIHVVNLRLMFGIHGPAEGSLAAPLRAVADLQRRGLVRHIGLSNVTPTQFEEARAPPTSSASRTSTISPTATTTPSSTRSQQRGSPMSPCSRSAASPRSSRRRCRRSRRGLEQRRCRSRSPGCFAAPPTSC